MCKFKSYPTCPGYLNVALLNVTDVNVDRQLALIILNKVYDM